MTTNMSAISRIKAFIFFAQHIKSILINEFSILFFVIATMPACTTSLPESSKKNILWNFHEASGIEISKKEILDIILKIYRTDNLILEERSIEKLFNSPPALKQALDVGNNPGLHWFRYNIDQTKYPELRVRYESRHGFNANGKTHVALIMDVKKEKLCIKPEEVERKIGVKFNMPFGGRNEVSSLEGLEKIERREIGTGYFDAISPQTPVLVIKIDNYCAYQIVFGGSFLKSGDGR